MLVVLVHFAEGESLAFGYEDRVITETPVAARREDEGAVDATLEHLAMIVGPLEPAEYAELSRVLMDLAEDLKFVADSLDGTRSLP